MIPTRIGQRVNGGYFAGFVRNDTVRAVIVAPSKYEYTRTRNTVPKTCFIVEKTNGMRATRILPDWFEDRNRVLSTNINGYTDWYIPSIAELTACSSNLGVVTTLSDSAECPYTIPTFLSNKTTAAFWFQVNMIEGFKLAPYLSSSIVRPKQNVLNAIMFGNGYTIDSEISSKWYVYVRPVRSDPII